LNNFKVRDSNLQPDIGQDEYAKYAMQRAAQQYQQSMSFNAGE